MNFSKYYLWRNPSGFSRFKDYLIRGDFMNLSEEGPLRSWGSERFPTHYPSLMLFSEFIHMAGDLKRLLNFKYITTELKS